MEKQWYLSKSRKGIVNNSACRNLNTILNQLQHFIWNKMPILAVMMIHTIQIVTRSLNDIIYYLFKMRAEKFFLI